MHNNCEKFLGLTDDLYAGGNYFMYSENYLAGNTYVKSVSTLMKTTEESNIHLLIRTMFNEAKGHGAKMLEVRGTSVMNQNLFNSIIAKRLGFTFEKLSESSFKLTAPIR